MSASAYDPPDWLTDAVKLQFADAVIAFLMAGGGIKIGQLTITNDMDTELVMNVVFPDGEHNIGAWIAACQSSPQTEEDGSA